VRLESPLIHDVKSCPLENMSKTALLIYVMFVVAMHSAMRLHAGENGSIASEAAVPQTVEIERLIRSLGAEDYQEREDATIGLVSIGRSALTRIIAESSNPDPEVVARTERILLEVAPELNSSALRCAACILDTHQSLQDRTEALDAILRMPEGTISTILSIAKHERESFLPAALRLLKAKQCSVRRRAATMVRLYSDVDISDTLAGQLAVAECRWDTLCDGNESSSALLAFALENTDNVTELRRLVRSIRFQLGTRGMGLAEPLVKLLSNANRAAVDEITKALVVMGYETEEIVPILLKRSPDAAIGLTSKGIYDVPRILEWVKRNPNNQKGIKSALFAIGQCGPTAEPFLSDLYGLIDDLEGKHPYIVCEALANIGKPTLPFIAEKLKHGEDYVLALSYLREEGTFGDRARDASLNRILFTKANKKQKFPIRGRVFEDPDMLVHRPAIEDAVPLMLETCPLLADSQQPVLRRAIAIISKDGKAQGREILDQLRSTKSSVVLHVALKSLADLKIYEQEAVDWCTEFLTHKHHATGAELERDETDIHNVISGLRRFDASLSNAVVAVSPFLTFVETPPPGLSEKNAKRLRSIAIMMLTDTARSCPASAQLLLKECGVTPYTLWLPACACPEGWTEAMVRQKASDGYVEQIERSPGEIAYSAARALMERPEAARRVLPRLNNMVETSSLSLDRRIYAASVCLRVGGHDAGLLAFLKESLTVAKLKIANRGSRSVNGRIPSLIAAVGSTARVGRPLLDDIARLCSEPGLSDWGRVMALEALYAVDNGGETASRAFIRALECPLAVLDRPRLTMRMRMLRLLQRAGVTDPELWDCLEKLGKHGNHYTIRRAARQILGTSPSRDAQLYAYSPKVLLGKGLGLTRQRPLAERHRTTEPSPRCDSLEAAHQE
jgi:hypothetical protein